MEEFNHPLLKKQLQEFYSKTEPVPQALLPLLGAVNRAYHKYEEEMTEFIDQHELDEQNIPKTANFILKASNNPSKKLLANRSVPRKIIELLEEMGRYKELPETNDLVKVADLLNNEISKRKVAEQAQQESEERWHELIENMPEAVQLSKNGIIKYLNPAGLKLYEIECLDDAIGLNLFSFANEKQQKTLQNRLKNLKKVSSVPSIEFPIRTKKGRIKCIEVSSNPIFYNGEIITQSILRDVTDKKKAENELKKALELERSYNELNKNFVSMVSHEFRTPLTSIHSTSELLLQFGDNFKGEELTKRIKRIYKSTIRLNRMIEDVLTIGKLASENNALDIQELDFEQILNDVLKIMETNELAGRTIHISTNTKPPCLLLIDINFIELILRNLLENAAKYSDAKTPINITYALKRNHFVLTLQDFGIGIPRGEQKLVFASFKRGSNTSNISGTGLGLAIVNKAIHRLNGAIEVESKVGKGTTFTVTLPIASKKPFLNFH